MLVLNQHRWLSFSLISLFLKGKEKNFNYILDHFFNKNYIYTKTSTSAKTSANAKTSIKGGGKTNLRTFSLAH
jgi:hypothetical protein